MKLIFQFHPWIQIVNDGETENYTDDEEEDEEVQESIPDVSDDPVSSF